MREIGRVILEALIVMAAGTGIALIANLRSDVGLKLGRDYLKPVASRPAPATGDSEVATRPATLPADSQDAAAQESAATDTTAGKIERLIQGAGLAPVRYEEVAALFADPRYQSDAFVFIDARNDKHYREGHIPGARRLDHVNPELTLDHVLPFVFGAEKVVIYCNGGDCDDSLFTAGYLRDTHGVNPAILSIYVGGFEEWRDKGQPVERGERLSGDIITGGVP